MQARIRPLARSEGLVVEALDDELLVYDRDRHKAHALNGTAATVWKACDGTRTVAELGELLAPDGETVTRQELVRAALEQLTSRHLLVEGVASAEASVSRREMFRKAALVGAVGLAVPVIRSIVAPTPAQAATCLPPGALCAASAQCCSGVCVGGFCT